MEYKIDGNLVNCQHDLNGNEILKSDVIKSWNTNINYEMLEEKLNVSANPILPYEGFIKLHDLNYVWED